MSDDTCPVCKNTYVHETEPSENQSTVSGIHACYDVQGDQLVMYIHGDVSVDG